MEEAAPEMSLGAGVPMHRWTGRGTALQKEGTVWTKTRHGTFGGLRGWECVKLGE